jgi:hypothetical protein
LRTSSCTANLPGFSLSHGRKPLAAQPTDRDGDVNSPTVLVLGEGRCSIKFAANLQVKVLLAGRTLFGLINNAGVAWPAPLLHQPLSDFRRIVEANLDGTFIVTQVDSTCLLLGFFFHVCCC